MATHDSIGDFLTILRNASKAGKETCSAQYSKIREGIVSILKDEGYDLSWIHYTAVGHWYAKLGYETVVRWNCKGIVE